MVPLLASLAHRPKSPQAEAVETWLERSPLQALSASRGVRTASYSMYARQVGVLILTSMCSMPLGRSNFSVFPSTQSVVVPLACPPMRVMYRVWSPHVTQPDAHKSHERAQCTVRQLSQPMERAGALMPQPPKKTGQNLFLFITPTRPHDKLQAGLLALRFHIWDFPDTKKLPRCLLEAQTGRYCPLCLVPRSTFGQRRPQVYTGEMFAQGPAGDREGLRSVASALGWR